MDWLDLLAPLLLFPAAGTIVIWTMHKRDRL